MILAKLVIPVIFGESGEFLVILVSLAKLIDTGESGEPGDSFGHCLHLQVSKISVNSLLLENVTYNWSLLSTCNWHG